MSRDELQPPPPFAGFHAAAFTFFETLAENQDRAWMAKHKAVYENAVRVPMAAVMADRPSPPRRRRACRPLAGAVSVKDADWRADQALAAHML